MKIGSILSSTLAIASIEANKHNITGSRAELVIVDDYELKDKKTGEYKSPVLKNSYPITIPRQLSTSNKSPHFNKRMCEAIDKVFVDGVEIPKCYAYDMDGNNPDNDKGWAFSKINKMWQPKVYGVVTVTLKEAS